METKKILASISADTSILNDKLQALLEVLPEHVPDELLSMISSLLGNIGFVNSPPTVSTGSTFNVVYIFDFDTAAYSEVMATARTFKTNLAH